jgi:hypothetical protein
VFFCIKKPLAKGATSEKILEVTKKINLRGGD